MWKAQAELADKEKFETPAAEMCETPMAMMVSPVLPPPPPPPPMPIWWNQREENAVVKVGRPAAGLAGFWWCRNWSGMWNHWDNQDPNQKPETKPIDQVAMGEPRWNSGSWRSITLCKFGGLVRAGGAAFAGLAQQASEWRLATVEEAKKLYEVWLKSSPLAGTLAAQGGPGRTNSPTTTCRRDGIAGAPADYAPRSVHVSGGSLSGKLKKGLDQRGKHDGQVAGSRRGDLLHQ